MQHQAVVSWLAHHNFPHGMVQFCDGLVADPLRQKTNYLNALIEEVDFVTSLANFEFTVSLQAGVIIHAAYGSSKDVQVYGAVGLKPDEIFCIGKASKKLQDRTTVSGVVCYAKGLCISDFTLFFLRVGIQCHIIGFPSRTLFGNLSIGHSLALQFGMQTAGRDTPPVLVHSKMLH